MSVEVLESLVTHPGWRLFQEHVAERWGPKAYAQALKDAVRQAREHRSDAGHAIELVDAANEAIADIMRWPSEHLARLRAQEQVLETTPSRRGGL